MLQWCSQKMGSLAGVGTLLMLRATSSMISASKTLFTWNRRDPCYCLFGQVTIPNKERDYRIELNPSEPGWKTQRRLVWNVGSVWQWSWAMARMSSSS
jgi:hypothetical protein